MAEPRELDQHEDDGGETLVTPRFDEEETVLAQPVVPLEADAAHAPAPTAYAPRSRAGRSPWPLALVLVSALAGSVVGGTALYLFQKHRRASAVAPAPVPAPAPSPTAEQSAEVMEPVETEPAVVEAEPLEETAREDEAKSRDEVERVPAPPAASASTPKRGKKAEHENVAPRPRRDDSRTSDGDGREARRVDSITYPTRREELREERRAQRRAERRERRAARNVDRVRAIFEGQP